MRPRKSSPASLVLIVALALSGCGAETAPSSPPGPLTGPVLPADMPPLVCADFEPPPVAKPTEKFTGRKCSNADGSIRWISGFHQCADGRIWPILTVEQPTGANRPAEPTGPAFDACLGRK